MADAVRTIVIVGRDAPAWIAALSLHKALGQTGVKVSVVELPSLLNGVEAYAALPSLQALHELLEVDEAAVLTAARGVPMVAQRFSNWNGDGAYLQGYDSAEAPGGFLSFVQLWIKARAQGLKVPFEEFSFGAMAARSGRVPSESDDPKALGATYGYHLDASAYSLLLRAFAVRRGIEVRSGLVRRVEVQAERIDAVELVSGERIAADLFIDASGSEAALLSTLPADQFESWQAHLPCDRLLSASVGQMTPRPAFSQISAIDGGWIGMFPLQERTAVTMAFQSSSMTPEQAVAQLQSLAGVAIGSDAIITTINPGVRKTPWIGNCIAIGEAAAALEPLDGLSLHLAHVCVSHMITFFPVDRDSAIEAAEYNTAVRLHAANLRDFQQTHYVLNGRAGEPFWDKARAAPMSDGLAQKLRMFQARGESVLYEEETFEAQSWAQMFLGHGCSPRSYDPRVDLIDQQDHMQSIQSRLREIGQTIPALPTIDAFLAATQIPIKASAAAS
ncbi:MAG: tryptophan 7-halogenase [Sphingomicrobium sp.]